MNLLDVLRIFVYVYNFYLRPDTAYISYCLYYITI
nr:MAG TPA: hypothetical protein [Caudoviricetes sp.]